MFIDKTTQEQWIFSYNYYREMTRQKKRYHPDAYIKYQVNLQHICITEDNGNGTAFDYKLLVRLGNS